jgi:glutamyl-Q tRNA(Asp) synthetase
LIGAPFVTRFAPSPSGLLHLGHAFSALTAWRAAQDAGGRFLLRIEDIDQGRSRPAFEAAICEDLAWLGVTWERPVRRQSEHLESYRAALSGLRDRGLLYRCSLTRRERLADIGRAPHGPVPAHHGGPLAPSQEARCLADGLPFAWRLSVDAARAALNDFSTLDFFEEGAGPQGEHGLIVAEPGRLGDVILGRKDGAVAYHLAVVLDDALQGVTHLIRGADLFEAAHIQRLLQALLDLPTPTYRHHRLVLDADGRRLSKRDGGSTLAGLRTGGTTPAEVWATFGFDDRSLLVSAR